MKKLLYSFILFLFSAQAASAQCPTPNMALKNGEMLRYDTYYKYGIVNAKAGNGYLSTTLTNYKGNRAYKTSLLANTSGTVGNMYTVRDTLTGYVDTNMIPLHFEKQTFEGKDYSREYQTYSYNKGKINVRAIRYWNGSLSFDEVVSTDKCVYDYISVTNYCRNLDYTNMKPGSRVNIKFLSGKDIVNMYISYKGVRNVKVNNGISYNAVELSMMIVDKAFTNPKEAMNVTLTNDQNRVPLIIQIGLKLGSLRVVLNKM